MNPLEPETPRYEQLSSPQQVREMVLEAEGARWVALEVQVEGPGAVGATLAGVSLSFEPGAAYHAPLGTGANGDALFQELLPLLGPEGIPKVMHDSKLGLLVLAQRGVETGVPAFDTLLAGTPVSTPRWASTRRPSFESCITFGMPSGPSRGRSSWKSASPFAPVPRGA